MKKVVTAKKVVTPYPKKVMTPKKVGVGAMQWRINNGAIGARAPGPELQGPPKYK